jgi:hypothetical protein
MKYILLINNSAEAARGWEGKTDAELRALHAAEAPRWNELFHWIGEQGIETSGLVLDLPQRTRVVRVDGGETIVTDGPFAETKEVLGGYLLADCKDLDQAIEVAQRVPVDNGSVEIRPLVVH